MEVKEISDLFFEFSLVNTDSREIKKDQIFLPLVGENFDGHDFIDKAFRSGAKLSFCEKKKVSKVQDVHRSNLILVENTLDAYQTIANHYRKKVNPKVIAITGSSGKTTTKDLISEVLSAKYKVHKTEANYNNEIGVPKTILEMPPDTEVLVLELAMRGSGEIKYLSKTSEPDIAVITNVGVAHIGRLGSKEAIVRAKCEILEHLRQNGIAILPNVPEVIECSKKIWSGSVVLFGPDMIQDIKYKSGKSFFKLNGESYEINAPGEIHILNSLAAILVAEHLGLTKKEIQNGLSNFNVPSGRGNPVKISSGIYLIDETYNANPDSVRAAVNTLVSSWDAKYKKILVLGELAELGECEDRLLTELNMWLSKIPLAHVVTVGDKLRQIKPPTPVKNVKNLEECCTILKELLTSESVVVIKGSHVANLKKVVDVLANRR